MKRHQEIIDQLQKLNFSLLPKQNFSSEIGAYFFHAPSQNSEVEKYLTVRYLRGRRYEIRFGFNCPALRHFFIHSNSISQPIAEALGRLNSYWPICWNSQSMRFGCWLNTWSCSADKEKMEDDFENHINDFMTDVILPINSMELLLKAYLTDEPPFEWSLGMSYFARMCEIAYLVAVLRSNDAEASDLVEKKYEIMLNRDLFGNELLSNFFSKLLENIKVELNFLHS